MESLNALFAKMHEALGKELLSRIESGEATASELSVARQFLNDNHVSGVPKPENPLGKLAQSLPAFEDSDKHYTN